MTVNMHQLETELATWKKLYYMADEENRKLRLVLDNLHRHVRHSATCASMWRDDEDCSCGAGDVRAEVRAVFGDLENK
jgi:hypothetical protein